MVFKAHGFLCQSNFGGLEIEISNCGDAVRLRDSHDGQVSEWMNIEYNEFNGECLPFFDNPFGDKKGTYCLNEFIRLN